MAEWNEAWRQLELPPARSAALLSDSPVARSWKIESEGRAHVLRVDKPLALALGLNREREFRNLERAWTAGLAPEPIRVVPAAGLLLTAWCEGDSWDGGSAHRWEAHGSLLARLHTLRSPSPPLPTEMLDPLAAGECYAQLCPDADSGRLLAQLASQWNELGGTGETCLCHNDAHRGNVIQSRSPVLIDWEYSAWGDPLCDLAVVWRYHQLTAAELELFLSGYGLSVDRKRLRRWADLYDLLAKLWAAAVGTDPSSNGIR